MRIWRMHPKIKDLNKKSPVALKNSQAIRKKQGTKWGARRLEANLERAAHKRIVARKIEELKLEEQGK